MTIQAEAKVPQSMYGESPEVLARYWGFIRKGESPGMASILATRRCPELGTDTARQVGIPSLEESLGPYTARLRKEEARKAGISISDNSHYNPTLADSRRGGDPKAWVHAGDGASHLKRRLREIGHGCEDLGVDLDAARVAEREEKKKQAFIAKQKRKYEKQAVQLEASRKRLA